MLPDLPILRADRHQRDTEHTAAMTHDYVLLGASNLTMAAPLLLENLRSNSSGRSVSVRMAMGFGRSYGGWSRFLFRELPGIVDSNLWEDLEQQTPEGTRIRALITDVGNDLLYGDSPPQIVDWVEICVQRLQKRDADIVLTLPPVESVFGLSRWRYALMRTVLFPNCRTPLPEMRRFAEELHTQLGELAARTDISTVASPGEWYGFDPVHIRRRVRSQVWQSVLNQWKETSDWNWRAKPSREMKRAAASAEPAVSRRRGKPRQREQPSLRIDQFSVSIF